MELKIISEKDNALFNRKEIEAVAESLVSPSREEVLKTLSEKFSVSPDTIKIKGIQGNFGVQKFDITANIYGSKQDKDSIELKKKKEADAEKKAEEAKKAAEESVKEESQPVAEEKSGSSESDKSSESSGEVKESEKTEGKSDQPEQEKSESKDEEPKEKSKDSEKEKPDKEPSQKPEETKSEASKE